MNAAQKAALRRRKDMGKPVLFISEDQNKEVRQAIVEKLAVILGGKPDARAISAEIEAQLFEDYGGVNDEYRGAFRRILISLKNKKTDFVKQLLDKELAPREFAAKKADDLKSKQQQNKDRQLKEKALKESVGQELLPENIQQVHDGRDREKWGVSRSAAAID